MRIGWSTAESIDDNISLTRVFNKIIGVLYDVIEGYIQFYLCKVNIAM